VLEETKPSNDSVVDVAPDEVVLRFNEPIESALGAVRIFDAAGNRVDTGELRRPDSRSVATTVPSNLRNGTYTVAWRVVSADSHPVFGAFVFHIGAPGANPAGIADQVLAESAPSRVESATFTAVRFFAFGLLILTVGGVAALALVLRECEEKARRRLLALVAIASAALALVSVAGIVLEGGVASGLGITGGLHGGVFGAVLDTRFGQVWLARAVVATLLAVVTLSLRRTQREWLLDAALVLCIPLVLSPAAAGHANTSGALSFAMDVAHVQAAAVWVGGLAALLVALLWSGGGRWELATTAVPRFSKLAAFSVAVLLMAGVVNAYLQIRSWSGLWSTTYGRLVLAKTALLIPILALGLYNNRRAVPRLRAGKASDRDRGRFLRAASAEIALVVAVVAVTAVLVAEPPARAVNAPSGPFAATTDLGDLELNLVVDPAVAGTNDVHFYLIRKSGQPADLAEVRLAASLPSHELGPLRFEARRVAPGHYIVTGAALPLAGDWQLNVNARRGEFESLAAALTVPIRKET
jgi:copper transport protein